MFVKPIKKVSIAALLSLAIIAVGLSPTLPRILGLGAAATAQSAGVDEAETFTESRRQTEQSVQSDLEEAEQLAARYDQTGSSCAKFIGICWYWWLPAGVIGLVTIAIIRGNRRDRMGSL